MAKNKKEEKEEKDGKKGGKKKFIFIAIGLVILGLGSFAGTYFFTKSNAEEEKKPIVKAYYDLGEFVVNLNDKSGKSYLKTRICIGYDSKNEEAEGILTSDNILLRDATNYYLKSKCTKDFDSKNEKKVKKELVKKLNSKLNEPIILDVYINDMMVQ